MLNKGVKMFLLLFLGAVIFVVFYRDKVINEIKYVNRKTDEVEIEKVPGEFWLKWLYYNPIGKLSVRSIVKRRFISEFYGKKMDERDSKFKIPKFVDDFNIDLGEAEKEYFDSFNDFFIRKLKKDARPIEQGEDVLVSPADGKILYFEDLSKIGTFFVKGSEFSLERFLTDKKLYKKYSEGALAIIRLAPADYHRYHLPVSGQVGKTKEIIGDYYSVSPYAVKHNINIYFENKRSITEINSVNMGDMLMVEVGATMVGSIIQNKNESYEGKKGDEKGYFKFGGSTIILVFEKNRVNIDKDIIENTKNGLETKIYMGEKIGVKA